MSVAEKIEMEHFIMDEFYDEVLAKLAEERAQRRRLAQLEQQLRELGAKWKAARGVRKSIQGENSEELTRLKQAIVEAVTAGMSERRAARVSGAHRNTVHSVVVAAASTKSKQTPKQDTPNGASP